MRRTSPAVMASMSGRRAVVLRWSFALPAAFTAQTALSFPACMAPVDDLYHSNDTSIMVGPDGVIPGFDDGGDGGLFGGILARYLADAAVRLPELAPLATKIVLTSAEAAWQGRTEVAGGPVFAPRWSRPAHQPGPGIPEADFSVQLSGWMLLEAAARAAGTITEQGQDLA